MFVPEYDEVILNKLEKLFPKDSLGMVRSAYAYTIPSIIERVNDLQRFIDAIDAGEEPAPSKEELEKLGEHLKKETIKDIQFVLNYFNSNAETHQLASLALNRVKGYLDTNIELLKSRALPETASMGMR